VKPGRGRIGKFKNGIDGDIEWWRDGNDGEDEVDWGDWSYCDVVRLEDFCESLQELNGHEGKAVQHFLNNLSNLEIDRLRVKNPNPSEEGDLFVDEFFANALAVEYGFKVDSWDLDTIAEEGKTRIEAGEREKRRREKQGNKRAKSLDAELDNLKEVCRLIDKELTKAKVKQATKAKEESAQPEPKSKKKSKRHQESAEHIQRIRTAAKELWKNDKTITISGMMYEDEIINASNGKIYSEWFYRKHLKDLAPSNNPGRRPKKK